MFCVQNFNKSAISKSIFIFATMMNQKNLKSIVKIKILFYVFVS